MRPIDADALNGYELGLISPKAQKLFHKIINDAPTIEQEPCEDAISRQAVLDLPKNTERDFSGNIIEQSINIEYIKALPSVTPAEKQEPCDDCIRREDALMALTGEYTDSPIEILPKAIKRINALPPVNPVEKMGQWIPVESALPELNRPLLVTAYHRVYYGHLISESGNYGYPVFRIHGLGDKNRDWVQETMSHEPYSLGRIDAWMYFNIPEPYKASPTGEEVG